MKKKKKKPEQGHLYLGTRTRIHLSIPDKPARSAENPRMYMIFFMSRVTQARSKLNKNNF